MNWRRAEMTAVAKAIREEIVRQYRDDGRTCRAGPAFYEEEIAPYLIAEAALKAHGKFQTRSPRAAMRKVNRDFDKKPLLWARIDEETYAEVMSYAAKERCSKAEAIRRLVEFGLEAIQ